MNWKFERTFNRVLMAVLIMIMDTATIVLVHGVGAKMFCITTTTLILTMIMWAVDKQMAQFEEES